MSPFPPSENKGYVSHFEITWPYVYDDDDYDDYKHNKITRNWDTF